MAKKEKEKVLSQSGVNTKPQVNGNDWLERFEKPCLTLKDEEKAKLLDFILIYGKGIEPLTVDEIEKVYEQFQSKRWKDFRNTEHKQAISQEDYHNISQKDSSNLFIDNKKEDKRKVFLAHLRNAIAHANFYYSKTLKTFEFLDKYVRTNKKQKKGDISAFIRMNSNSFWKIINYFTNNEKQQ